MAIETEVVQIQFRQGLRADLVAATDLIPGEPLYATDTLEMGVVLKDGTIIWMCTAAKGANKAVLASEKGTANGIATLNAQGKLNQMPTAPDVGARPDTWMPSLSDLGVVFGGDKNNGYKKFSNGWMEAWGRKLYTSVPLTAEWGIPGSLLYDSGNIKLIGDNFLIPFVGDPPDVFFATKNTNGGHMIELGAQAPTLTNPGGIWITRAGAQAAFYCTLVWRAQGLWK